MTVNNRGFMTEQVTVRLTNDLLDRVDLLASDALHARGSWIRTAILEKVRKEEMTSASQIRPTH